MTPSVVFSSSLLGVGLAILGAIGFAVQYLCIRLGTENGDVRDAVLVVSVCNVVLLGVPALVLYPRPYTALFTPRSAIAFAIAGIAGIFLARLLLFTSIERIGANLTSPVIASNVFFATIFAVVVLGERLTLVHALGIVCIVAGIAIVSWETAEDGPERSVREVGLSLSMPLAAAVLIGTEPIFIALGLAEGTAMLPGMVLMALAGTLGFVSYLAVSGSLAPVPLWSRSTAWYVGGGVSTTVGFVGYVAALEVVPVVVVMPLLQLTPLLVVGLSALLLPTLERVTWRVVASALVVVVGAALVSVSG